MAEISRNSDWISAEPESCRGQLLQGAFRQFRHLAKDRDGELDNPNEIAVIERLKGLEDDHRAELDTPDKLVSVVLLGHTGVGKSFWTNTLLELSQPEDEKYPSLDDDENEYQKSGFSISILPPPSEDLLVKESNYDKLIQGLSLAPESIPPDVCWLLPCQNSQGGTTRVPCHIRATSGRFRLEEEYFTEEEARGLAACPETYGDEASVEEQNPDFRSCRERFAIQLSGDFRDDLVDFTTAATVGEVVIHPDAYNLLGKKVCYLTQGQSLTADRIAIRERLRELAPAAGVEVEASDALWRNLLCKSRVIFVPSSLLAFTRGSLVDPPGTGDSDMFHNRALVQSLRDADGAIVIAEKSGGCEEEIKKLISTGTMDRVIEGSFKLVVFVNLEKSLKYPSVKTLLSPELQTSLAKTKSEVREMFLKQLKAECRTEDETLYRKLTEKVQNNISVRVILPRIMQTALKNMRTGVGEFESVDQLIAVLEHSGISDMLTDLVDMLGGDPADLVIEKLCASLDQLVELNSRRGRKGGIGHTMTPPVITSLLRKTRKDERIQQLSTQLLTSFDSAIIGKFSEDLSTVTRNWVSGVTKVLLDHSNGISKKFLETLNKLNSHEHLSRFLADMKHKGKLAELSDILFPEEWVPISKLNVYITTTMAKYVDQYNQLLSNHFRTALKELPIDEKVLQYVLSLEHDNFGGVLRGALRGYFRHRRTLFDILTVRVQSAITEVCGDLEDENPVSNRKNCQKIREGIAKWFGSNINNLFEHNFVDAMSKSLGEYRTEVTGILQAMLVRKKNSSETVWRHFRKVLELYNVHVTAVASAEISPETRTLLSALEPILVQLKGALSTKTDYLAFLLLSKKNKHEVPGENLQIYGSFEKMNMDSVNWNALKDSSRSSVASTYGGLTVMSPAKSTNMSHEMSFYSLSRCLAQLFYGDQLIDRVLSWMLCVYAGNPSYREKFQAKFGRSFSDVYTAMTQSSGEEGFSSDVVFLFHCAMMYGVYISVCFIEGPLTQRFSVLDYMQYEYPTDRAGPTVLYINESYHWLGNFAPEPSTSEVDNVLLPAALTVKAAVQKKQERIVTNIIESLQNQVMHESWAGLRAQVAGLIELLVALSQTNPSDTRSFVKNCSDVLECTLRLIVSARCEGVNEAELSDDELAHEATHSLPLLENESLTQRRDDHSSARALQRLHQRLSKTGEEATAVEIVASLRACVRWAKKIAFNDHFAVVEEVVIPHTSTALGRSSNMSTIAQSALSHRTAHASATASKSTTGKGKTDTTVRERDHDWDIERSGKQKQVAKSSVSLTTVTTTTTKSGGYRSPEPSQDRPPQRPRH